MQRSKQKIPHLFLILNGIVVCLIAISLFYMVSHSSSFSSQTIQSGSSDQFKTVAKSIRTDCVNKDIEKCYTKHFFTITAEKGLVYAEKTLYALQDFDPQLRHCHVLSHEIARAAVRKNPKDWKKMIDEVDVNTCGGGFLHGILEAHVGDDPKFVINSKSINDLCYKDGTSFRERTCSHIMGHLILIDTEGKVDPALPICAGVKSYFSLDCYEGIFMEDSFKFALVDHGFAQAVVRDEPRMITQTNRCYKYDGTAGIACWKDLAEIFAEFYNYDPQKTYESCNQAPTQEERKQCYLKGVILMAVSPQFSTSDKLLAACQPFADDNTAYTHCIDFIISSLMYYSPKFADRGKVLCSAVDQEYQSYCFKDLGEKLKMNVTERGDRQRLCEGVPQMYTADCIN